MTPTNLPFDEATMLKGLKTWVECESPTFDAVAVDRMMALAGRELAEAGATVTHFAGRMGFGGCVRGSFPHEKDGPGVLVLGHLDTVHPVGTLEKLPIRQEGERCYGPGIFDMKGGNYLALEAVRQLAKAGLKTPLPVTFLFTSDEEVGSPSTRELIEAEAKKHAYVLVPEPGRDNGGVVSGRYAIARYNLLATGKPSHAGFIERAGRSAIRLMAQKILEIEAMNGPDCSFSVGVVHGGQWVNCVSTVCRGEVLSMAKRQADLDQGVARMLAHSGTQDGVVFEVTRGVTRPVWEPDAGTMKLFTLAAEIASDLGVTLTHESSGGGSDGNFTGALGIPTLDGLGVMGANPHTLQEYILTASLPLRAKLFAGLLMRLA